MFARHAFNELVSFVAGWAILLDYTILIAVTAFTATQYLGTFWRPLAHKGPALALVIAFIATVVAGTSVASATNARAASAAARRRPCAPGADRRASGWCCSSSPERCQLDPPRFRADMAQPAVRADDHRRGVHQPRVGFGHRLRGPDRPARAEAPRRFDRRAPSRSSTSASRSSRSAPTRSRTARRAPDPVRKRPDGRDRQGDAPALARAVARVHRRRHGGRSRCSRPPTRRCSASRGSPTACPPTARSRPRSGGCTRGARRPTC